MILFDLGEVADLKRNAKNHREFIVEKKSPLMPAILPFISFLQFNVRRYASSRPSNKVLQAYRDDYQETIKHLQACENQGDGTNRLLFGTCMQWLRLKER